MTRIRCSSLVAALGIVAAAGCSDRPAPVGPGSMPSPASERSGEPSSAPLVRHVVAPQATDPAIDRALDDHYAWLDTSASAVHRLFVFLPGTRQTPSQTQLVPQEAARLGYHVVGLMYPNNDALARLCPPTADPAACYEASRLEAIDGIDRGAIVSVTPTNSIDNRLIRLLRYLEDHFPDEGWSQYLDGDAPRWPLIAVGGLSQGGGEAAMIARIRLVDRVVMFSSVTDSMRGESVPWVGMPHATPINRYWGLAHDRDAFYPAILAGWDSLGLARFGAATLVEANAPPYGWSHALVTDLTPQGGFVGLNAHASTATDLATPLGPDGTPALRDAWRYLLSALPRRAGESGQPAVPDAGSGGAR